MSRKLLKSTFIAGLMTLVSRVTGLIRDIAFANYLASGVAADVFFVAFRIPNFFRRIFAEGAFSAAFIPVFSELRGQKSVEEVRSFLALMSGRLAIVLLILSAVVILSAPAVVAVIAPGFVDDAEKFAMTTQALRITFPYLFFISMVAMSAAVLNTVDRFAVPAATPVLLNLCLIAAIVWLVPIFDNASNALAWGVALAGLVQLVFQLPFLRREQLLVIPRFRQKSTADEAGAEGTRRVLKLMLPAMFGVSVAQINVLVNTILASFLVTGSISWLYYSDRLMEFPVGVFGIALATVILPSLSVKHQRENASAFSDTLDWALRWVVLITLPAMLGLIVLAKPMISTIYYHGKFQVNDVEMVAQSLVAFTVGLLAIILVKVLAPGFYARQDVRTPVRIGIIAMAVNIIFSIGLVASLKHVGLALATSLAAITNATLLFYQLRKEGVYTPKAGWPKFIFQVLAATAMLSFAMYYFSGDAAQWLEISMLQRIGWLSALILGGVVVYVIGIFLLGIRPKQLIMQSESE